MPVAGTIIAFALSWVYGYLTNYNPFIYINFIATGGFAFLTGLAIWGGASWGKVRNGTLTFILGLGVGCLALYCGWATWMMALINQSAEEPIPFEAAFHPVVLWDLILVINKEGAWGIGSSGEPVTGVFLWILWGIEAIAIVGITAIFPTINVTSTPFCEDCDCWTEEREKAAFLEPTEEDMLKGALEQGTFEVLTLLPAAPAENRDSLHIDLHTCPSCTSTNYLTVKRVTITQDSKGKDETNTNEFVQNLSIPHDVVEQVGTIEAPAPQVEAMDDAEDVENKPEAENSPA
jgi:hypothetical protein